MADTVTHRREPAPLALDWPNIDTILLDLDGTLLDLHFDNHFWLEHVPLRYAQTHRLDHAQARAMMRERSAAIQGTLPWYSLDHWRDDLSLDILALKREVAHLIAPRPNADLFLAALNSAGKRVMLATNAHPDSVALKLERVPLAGYFDSLHTSHDYAQPKETLDFWLALHRGTQFDPARTLFIDDNDAVLATAARFGISHLLGVHQPDSRGGCISHGPFERLRDFKQLLPVSG